MRIYPFYIKPTIYALSRVGLSSLYFFFLHLLVIGLFIHNWFNLWWVYLIAATIYLGTGVRYLFRTNYSKFWRWVEQNPEKACVFFIDSLGWVLVYPGGKFSPLPYSDFRKQVERPFTFYVPSLGKTKVYRIKGHFMDIPTESYSSY